MSIPSIQNIIFDLGGVILNIDPQLTINAFRKLGWNDFYEGSDLTLTKELFFNFEKGTSTPEAFRDKVRQRIKKQLEDAAIDEAWTAMILDIPANRIRYIEELKKSCRIFLLSNTNEIHRLKFHRIFETTFGYSFYDLFERNFYSHEMGMRKPDPQIYITALTEAGIEPERTLFIDDMAENVEVAKLTGMHGLHILPGTLMDILPEYLKNK